MYTPIIDVIRHGKTEQIQLPNEKTLKKAVEARELFMQEHISPNFFPKEYRRGPRT